MSLLSVEVNNLIEGTAAKLVRLRQRVEGESTGSSDSSSFDSFSSDDEAMLGMRKKMTRLKKMKKSTRFRI